MSDPLSNHQIGDGIAHRFDCPLVTRGGPCNCVDRAQLALDAMREAAQRDINTSQPLAGIVPALIGIGHWLGALHGLLVEIRQEEAQTVQMPRYDPNAYGPKDPA